MVTGIMAAMEREDWNRRWRERSLHCHGDDPGSVLAAEVGPLLPGRALDLACGAGRNAIWLAERGWKVTAVDFSDEALAIARRARSDVEWVEADLRDYEPEPEAYDLALVLYLHVDRDERRIILRRAAASLAPGGVLLVVGHDVENIGTGAPGPSRPEVLYTPDTIAGELAGLAVERAERVTRAVDGAEAVDTVVLATRAAA
jgi:SAM-dependent methyltransferase